MNIKFALNIWKLIVESVADYTRACASSNLVVKNNENICYINTLYKNRKSITDDTPLSSEMLCYVIPFVQLTIKELMDHLNQPNETEWTCGHNRILRKIRLRQNHQQPAKSNDSYFDAASNSRNGNDIPTAKCGRKFCMAFWAVRQVE